MSREKKYVYRSLIIILFSCVVYQCILECKENVASKNAVGHYRL